MLWWWDFPGGPVVKDLPFSARDAASAPGWRTEIPCTVEQVSPPALHLEHLHCSERYCMMQRRSHKPQLRCKSAKQFFYLMLWWQKNTLVVRNG